MICEACKAGFHPECTNPTTCPCQHRRTERMSDGSVTPLSQRDALLGTHPLTTPDLFLAQEAIASTKLDREGDGQTFSLGDSGGLGVSDRIN